MNLSLFIVVLQATVMKDKYSGRSRGFGFVTYETPAAATSAIEAMNGTVRKRLLFCLCSCLQRRKSLFSVASTPGRSCVGIVQGSASEYILFSFIALQKMYSGGG